MKIYTKIGDKGLTSLIGGKKIPKSDIQVESYGSIDELNAFIGLIISQDIKLSDRDFLINIQKSLFMIGNYIASDYSEETACNLKPKNIFELEKEIDKLSSSLEPLNNFILPTGNQVVGFCHVARTVCRRAERVLILQNDKKKIDQNILIYMNRLSDYLFVLSRKFSKEFGIEEQVL